MGITPLGIDVRATNLAISYDYKNVFWRNVFGKSMLVPSVHTWYPMFDETSYRYLDDRDQFRHSLDGGPAPEVRLQYTKKELVIHGYHARSTLYRDEIEEAKTDTINDLEERHVEGLVIKLNRFLDLDVAEMFVDTSLWNNNAVDNAWTDQVDGDPERDIRQARLQVMKQCFNARKPNTIIASPEAWNHFWTHEKIKGRYDSVYGGADEKRRAFFNMFDIPPERVFEAEIVSNTARKGKTATPESVFGAFLWIGYIAPKPGINDPSAMTPVSLQYYKQNKSGLYVSVINRMSGEPFEENMRHGIRYNGVQRTEVVQTAPELGYLLTGLYS